MANTITSFVCSLQTIVSKRERDLLIDKELNSVKPLWNPTVRRRVLGVWVWGSGCRVQGLSVVHAFQLTSWDIR